MMDESTLSKIWIKLTPLEVFKVPNNENTVDLEQAASRLAKSLQAKLFSRLAWLACFFELEKAWLAGPKLGLACKEKKLAYVRLGLACMKAQ